MPEQELFGRRVCLCIDAESYSQRLEPEQAELQGHLVQVLSAAAQAARLNHTKWDVQQLGDGQLALAPLDESEPRFVDDFVMHLDAELARHNRQLVPEARLRLRVALHTGVAYPAQNGFAGDGVILVNRLINSAASRQALASTEANLILLISGPMYQDTVLAEHTTLRAEEFTEVTINEEKINTNAWLWVPAYARTESIQEARASRSGRVQQAKRDVNATVTQYAEVITNVQDGVYAHTVHFGPTTIAAGERGDD